MTTPTAKQKLQAQQDYCNKKKIPFFISNDGICFGCHRQIMDKITMEKASTELITGCPYCNRSYCE